MTTHVHDERREPTPRLVARLRREARSGRPAFSPEFQARLVNRLEAGPPRPAATAPSGRATLPARWRSVASLAAGLAVVSALAVLAAWFPGAQSRPPAAILATPAGALADLRSAPGVAGEREPDEAPAFMISPLYDEIETGLRDGAQALAESLVELPAWMSLADFDAAAVLAATIGP